MKLCITSTLSIEVGARVACTELARRIGYSDIEQEEIEGQARVTLTGQGIDKAVFRGKSLERAYEAAVQKLIALAVKKYGGGEP